MKLAEAKRRIQKGSTLVAEGHRFAAATGRRTVTKVQTNGFWYSAPSLGETRGWFEWPKAAQIRSNSPDSFTLTTPEGDPVTTFTLESA